MTIDVLREEQLAIARYEADAVIRRRAQIAAMTPEQREAYSEEVNKRILANIQERLAWKTEWNSGIEAGRNLGPMPLTERGEILRDIILLRDWNALFKLIPVQLWPNNWSLSKYSFTGDGANKQYVAWTEADLQSFIFSPYYTVQAGYVCTDEQRELGVAAYWQAQSRHKQKFTSVSYHYVWPIYPGGGYGSQTYGCEQYRPGLWVKTRMVVVIAAAIVAAVYLGPIVLSKITALGTGGGTSSGIVGAGTKAGVVTAITTKAGAAAVVATAAETATFFQTVQSGTNTLLGYVNKARTIEAIVKGEMPPPPISVVGDSFTDWAMIVAKEQLVKEAKERAIEYGVEYVQRKMTEKEEAKLRAEIKVMQAELASLIPSNVIASPDSRVPAEVQAASVALALKEKQAQDSMLAALAIAVPVGFIVLS